MAMSDTWMQRAQALCEAAQAHPAVASVEQDARYETRGPAAVVRGVHLRRGSHGAQARLGIRLRGAALAQCGSVPAAAQAVRMALHERWAALGGGEPLVVSLDVLDITDPGRPAADATG